MTRLGFPGDHDVIDLNLPYKHSLNKQLTISSRIQTSSTKMSSGSTVHPASGPSGPTSGDPQSGARYEQAPPNAHSVLDSKDQRSLKNNLGAAEGANKILIKEEKDAPPPTEAAKSVSIGVVSAHALT